MLFSSPVTLVLFRLFRFLIIKAKDSFDTVHLLLAFKQLIARRDLAGFTGGPGAVNVLAYEHC